MPLHTDYRPSNLDEVYGNESTKDSLNSLFARENHPHSYLLHGPSGTGKTTIGRIIASMLKCSESDLYEYNMANTRGIDTIRDIAMTVHYSPIEGPVKVYILDECARQTQDSQSALLKLLEDTPSHIYFILCTTDPEKLLPTIRNRCTTFQTKLLPPKLIKQLINDVLISEEKEDLSKEIISEIIKLADGCPRQALVLLDTVINIKDEDKAIEALNTVNPDEAAVIDICRLIVQVKNIGKWKEMVPLIRNLSDEPEKVRFAVLGYLSAVLLNKGESRISDIMEVFFDNWYYTKRSGMIHALYLACQM